LPSHHETHETETAYDRDCNTVNRRLAEFLKVANRPNLLGGLAFCR